MRTAGLSLLLACTWVAPAHALSLEEAIAAALAKNPTLEGARADAKAAREGRTQALSGYLPQVSAFGGYQSRELKQNSPSLFGGTVVETETRESTNFGVEADVPLFTGFRRSGQLGAAQASSRAAEEALRATAQGVILDAIVAYVDVRRDAEVVRIRLNNVEVLSRQLQAARDRFEVGETTRTDVAQAEARLAAGQADLALARAALESAKAVFVEVIGAPAEGLEAPTSTPATPEGLETAIAVALDANPSLAAQREVERAAAAQVQIERADLLPQLSLIGRLQRDENAQFDGSDAESAVASAQLTVPLFTGGFSASQVREAKAGLASAEAQTEEARRAVVSAVTGAWNNLLAAREVILASQGQVAATALALEGVEEELKVGLRTTLDVLNAQQEALEAQLALVRAERDAFVAANALTAAIGRLDPSVFGLNDVLSEPPESSWRGRWTVFRNLTGQDEDDESR